MGVHIFGKFNEYSSLIRTALLVVRKFIGSVHAVVGTIAGPRLRNALSVAAAELPWLALSVLAVDLLRAVAAVVDAIADLERQRAVEVDALKLPGWTVSFHWTIPHVRLSKYKTSQIYC